MTTLNPVLNNLRLKWANGYDLAHLLGSAGYEEGHATDKSVGYVHPTGSTVVALLDKDTGAWQALTASTPVPPGAQPDDVATIAFTGATPFGVIAAALSCPDWVEACEQASTTVEERRQQRIAQLRAELVRLEAEAGADQ